MIPKKRKVTRVIWTRAYSPWILGGDVRAPIGCQVEGEVVELGKGFQGIVVDTPSGGIVVAEFTTGAIVGTDLEEVRADVETGDDVVMRHQVEQARNLLKKMRIVSTVEFWDRYEKVES